MRRVLAYIKVYYKFPRRALLAAQTWILVIFIPLENSGKGKTWIWSENNKKISDLDYSTIRTP